MNIQINNGVINSASYASFVQDSANNFRIGNIGDNNNGFWWNGRVDEVGIWKKALSAQERADLYNAGTGNSFSSVSQLFARDTDRTLKDRLVAYYAMEEAGGIRADATDLSQLASEISLPADRISLDRMREQGTLQLIQPDDAVRPEPVEGRTATTLSRATVTYQGKPRETFTYRYEGELTHVTDSSGTTRAYDATHRLVAIDQPDGARYDVSHANDLSPQQTEALQAGRKRILTYTDLSGNQQTLELPDPDLAPFEERAGEEITIQHLSRRLLADGTELLYQFGRLHKIRLPDGRALTDFTVDQNGIPLRATLTLPDGTTKQIQNGALVEVTRSDGVKLRYRNNAIAEIYVPMNILNDVTVSAVGLDAAGQLASGEILLPTGDRLFISGGRFTSARLADGTEIRSVIVNQDSVTGATLSVSGSNATLNSARDVAVTLPSGQEYRYRYKLDSAGRPTSELETMTFRDDFEDGNSLGWTIIRGEWQITGGDFRTVETSFADSGPPRDTIATTGLNWTDYTVTTRFQYETITHKSNEAHLRFRYQDENNWYSIRTMNPNGEWGLWVAGRVGGQGINQRLASIPAISAGGDHTLTVEVRGSNFKFYLDGTYYGEYSDSALSRGTVGLGVAHGIARFHDIEVTFPGEDLRDPATREVDRKLRDLRAAVAQASGSIAQIGAVPAAFDPSAVDPARVRVLEVSSDPDVQAAVTAVVQAASDPSLPVISEYNAKDELLSSVALDGSTTLYEGSQPAARYDRDGSLEITYAYQNGYLSKVTYIQAREKLTEQMEAIRAEIHQREAKGLELLAGQRQVAFGQLKADAQVAREQLANSLLTLEEETHSLEGMDVSGKAGRRQKSQALNQLRSGVVQIQDTQVQFEQQYAQELGKLDSEVERVRQQISSETAQTFAQIDEQQMELTKQLLRQELEPILYQQYRTGMGRDPDEAEIHQVIDALYDQAGNNPEAALDLNTLRAQIQATSDYQTRRDQVAQIKQSVRDWMTRYLQASESDKTEMLAALGLTPEEVVPLTGEEINRILNWLDSRSLHFGHSAFLALQEQLVANGIQVDSTTLGLETILIDILVGVLHPKVKNSSELELSLFALNRVAKLHGLTTTPVQVTFENLRGILSTSPAIAHVNGNHYILVQSIADDGTVTYREPNAGPTGQTLTMTQQAFERVWKGVLLSPRAPPHAYQVLTNQEAQSITGSFFPFLIPIFIAILTAITTAVTAVITAIGALLATLGTLLSSVFTAFGTAFSALFQGLGAILSGNILGGLATIGQGLFTGVTGVFSAVLNFGAGLFGVGSFGELFTLGGLKAFALHTIVPTVLNIGVTRGLEALGVNSTVASLIGAFAGGFVAGIPSAGASASSTAAAGSTGFLKSAFASAVTSTAIAGTQLGLVKAGLDPALASLAGIGVGSITNSMLSGVSVPSAYDPVTHQPIANSVIPWHTATGLAGLGYTLSTSLAPTLAGELAYYGIQRLGAIAGIDPRISQLAGIPLSSAVKATVTPGRTAEGITNAIWEGLKSGVTSVGVNMATQALGLDSFAGTLVSRTLSGAISGAISPSHNVFQGVYNAFRDSVGNFSTIPPPPDPEDPRFIKTLDSGEKVWNQAAYNQAIVQYEASRPVWTSEALAKTNNFNDDIREHGLAAAVENYATSIFHRDSVESLVQSFGTIKNAITQRMRENPDFRSKKPFLSRLSTERGAKKWKT